MPKFETFVRTVRPVAVQPQITVLRRGTMSLNRSAFEALGRPRAVELLYDALEHVVGLRPVDPRSANAYAVRTPAGEAKGPYLITAMAFTKFHAIDTTQSLRREAFVADGVLCVSLDDVAIPVTSNRARKPGLDARSA